MRKYVHTTQTQNNDMIFQIRKHIIRECSVSFCAKKCTVGTRKDRFSILFSRTIFFCTEGAIVEKEKRENVTAVDKISFFSWTTLKF